MNSDEEDEVVAQLKHVTLVLSFIVLLEKKTNYNRTSPLHNSKLNL